MELVLKVYNAGVISTQIQNISEATINYDINNFASCSLKIPVIDGLTKYSKIEVCEVTTIDTIIFTGYIYDLIVSIDSIEILGRGIKELMNKKLILSDKSYTNQLMTTIINDILNDWNTAYSETWTFLTNDTTLITKDYKLGDNIFDILEELSGLVGMVWDVIDEEIIVANLLGEDKTTGLNYLALIYNGMDPYESNITKPVSKSYSTISNVIIGMDSTGKTTLSDPTSITSFSALGESKSFREGDRSTQTQQYLDSKKYEQRMFEFDVEESGLGINAGDKLKLIIENANSYLDFEGEVFVNTKQILFKNRTKIESVGVGDIYVYVDNILNKIRQIDKNIKLLNL
ncbi:MAG: hypothetical protein PHN31_01925 [Candidatus Gracilibacteria bacterium]|nr:hypothetical protein [Candidatus Gracilibacteria bacterium]